MDLASNLAICLHILSLKVKRAGILSHFPSRDHPNLTTRFCQGRDSNSPCAFECSQMGTGNKKNHHDATNVVMN
jgi:hypothetical protein